MKVLGVSLSSPYRKRLVSLDEPAPTPHKTSSGHAIKSNLVRALDTQRRAVLACSDALDSAIVAARRVSDSVPPRG